MCWAPPVYSAIWILWIQRAKSCFKKLEAPAGKRQINHLLPRGVSSADVEESPGQQETGLGIGLSRNSGAGICEDSQEKMRHFH